MYIKLSILAASRPVYFTSVRSKNPTKHEVKFEDGRHVYTLLQSVIKKTLGTHFVIPTDTQMLNATAVKPTQNLFGIEWQTLLSEKKEEILEKVEEKEEENLEEIKEILEEEKDAEEILEAVEGEEEKVRSSLFYPYPGLWIRIQVFLADLVFFQRFVTDLILLQKL